MTRNGIPHDLALRPRPSSTFPAVISAASGSSPLRKTKLSGVGPRGEVSRDRAPAAGVHVIYSGVLAANAALRPEVIPKVPTSTDAEQAAREARKLKRRDGPTPSLRAQLTLS